MLLGILIPTFAKFKRKYSRSLVSFEKYCKIKCCIFKKRFIINWNWLLQWDTSAILKITNQRIFWNLYPTDTQYKFLFVPPCLHMMKRLFHLNMTRTYISPFKMAPMLRFCHLDRTIKTFHELEKKNKLHVHTYIDLSLYSDGLI